MSVSIQGNFGLTKVDNMNQLSSFGIVVYRVCR